MKVVVTGFLVVLALTPMSSLRAQTTFPINLTNLEAALLAQAPPDECFIALGMNVRGNFPPCQEGQIPKVNQAYAWSMVQTGNLIWFGTTANPLCTDLAKEAFEGKEPPYQTPDWVCEFGESPYSYGRS
jgi:hypothetical protein